MEPEKQELIPYTIDQILQLRGVEKTVALQIRKDWLLRQRKQDRKERKTIEKKVWRKKNRLEHNKYMREYYARKKQEQEQEQE